MIIFTSDNGPTFLEEVDTDFFNSAGVLNGSRDRLKGSVNEGGIRVPFIISGPGIMPGSRSSIPISGVDILPTIQDLVSSKVEYDKKIDELGGIDFQLLGIGRTGHIGFNEPGSSVNSVTRLVELDYITKQDALGSFSGFENVPNRAITMGINTILNAKRIVLIAWGENKKDVVIKAVESNISSKLPSSFLQNHPNTTFVLDNGSSLELTRIKNPWLVGSVDWNIELKTRAISWLCNKVDKPILRLSNKDYNENNLSELLENHSVYDLNIEIFNRIQRTITGWPGGKPNSYYTNSPERKSPSKKKNHNF